MTDDAVLRILKYSVTATLTAIIIYIICQLPEGPNVSKLGAAPVQAGQVRHDVYELTELRNIGKTNLQTQTDRVSEINLDWFTSVNVFYIPSLYVYAIQYYVYNDARFH